MSDARPHAWYARQIPELRAGLLSEAVEREVREHAATCDACRDTLAETDAAGEHVPAALLARWPAAGALLPAFERELVEHHLTRCAACREDLALASAATAAAPAREVVALPRRSWRARAPWLVAAAAAAVLVALAPPVFRHAPQPERAALALDVQPGADGVRLHDVMRGAAASETTLTPGAREPIALVVEPLDEPDATPVTLELSRDGEGVLARTVRLQRELYPARHLVLGDARAPLPDGRWSLRVIATPSGARPDTLSYAFTVQRRR